MAATDTEQKFRAALVQMCSGRSVEHNIADATGHIRAAAADGADYVQTPEVTTLMERDRDCALRACQPEHKNPALAQFQALAHELEIWLHIGSMPILLPDNQLANRSYLIAPTGEITKRYDKIHMFDVSLPNGETHNESRTYHPGKTAATASLPWATLGLTICYDLRFPYLYRALAKAGAEIISVPAAFTRQTGKAHWHVLLRARAIEAQCFIIAANQTGQHDDGRETYGHSLIVSPWGEILAEAGDTPAVIAANIDLALVRQVRESVPSLQHDRAFDFDEQRSERTIEPAT